MDTHRDSRDISFLWKDDFSHGKLDMTNIFWHKNYTSNLHRHEYFEINIISEGEGFHYINSGKHSVNRGDIYIIPPYVSHRYESKNGLCVYNVLVTTRFLIKYQDELSIMRGFYFLFSPMINKVPLNSAFNYFKATEQYMTKLDRFLKLFWQLGEMKYNEIINSRTGKSQAGFFTPELNILSASLTLILMTLLCKYYTTKHVLPYETKAGRNDDFAKSIHYVYQHYNEKILVSELAAQANMSLSAYTNFFKDQFGITPAVFISRYRISVAKHLLDKGCSVTHAALETGFYDHSHFIKTFDKYEKVSPSEYVNKIKRI